MKFSSGMLRFLTHFIPMFHFFNGFQYSAVFPAKFRKTKMYGKIGFSCPVDIYLFKVNNRKKEKGVKYQSQQ